MRRVSLCLLGVLLVAAAWARPAAAEIRRYALLVGANQGYAHETPLRYAESDVQAVAETLQQLGGFASERIVRLLAPTPARVRNAIVDLNLTIQEAVRSGHEAVLFVYYSGHADGQNLHLGPAELSAEDFSKLVRLSHAKLKVLLVDACRSGAITRVKGGRQIPPFQIGVTDQLRNEGFAVITSSSAGEDAQESDALRSSIFTHHFLAALRGPADTNGDLQVTLGEAYAYAYEQSLKTSLGTVLGSQHATFNYDLRGRADPVLADLRSVGDQARLVLTTTGEYLLLAADTEAVVVEANVRAPRSSMFVPAAQYRVRLRTRSNVYQGDLALRAGQSATVGESNLRPVPLATVVRKGGTDAALAQGPVVNGFVHGPLAAGFSPMIGAQVGYALELPHVTLLPRVSFARGDSRRAAASHTLTEVTAELTALYVLDFERLSVAPLISLGWGAFSQRVAHEAGASCTAPCETRTRPQALVSTIGALGALPIGRGFQLELAAELANFYLRRQQSRDGIQQDAPRFGTLTYRLGAGVGYRF